MAGQHSDQILLQNGSSCAIADLSGLCAYGGRPDDAMSDLLKQIKYVQPCIIVFHGVIEAPPRERDEKGGWCRGCKYIQEFVAFIRDNNLGDVKEGVTAENKQNHPGHIIQAVTWAPNYKALAAWKPSKKSITL